MAYAKIASASTGALATATTGSIDTSGANLIVITQAYLGSPTLSDSKSNTWSHLTTTSGGGGGPIVRISYAFNPTVGSGHTFTLAATAPSLAAIAFSGSTSSPFDQESGGTLDTSTTIDTGSVTPSEDNELLVACFSTFEANETAASVNSSFTMDQEFVNAALSYSMHMAFKIQTTAGAENAGFSWTGAVTAAAARIATFKAAAAAAVGTEFIGSMPIPRPMIRNIAY